jgi:hypothetical protein
MVNTTTTMSMTKNQEIRETTEAEGILRIGKEHWNEKKGHQYRAR